MQEFFVANNRVDIARNQIIREGEIIALEPKVLEVLRVLAQHQGEVVSHQQLLDTVWPNIVVAPNALQRCIGQLRKALGDDGKRQQVIATHPKKGYSLLAPVTIRSDVENSQPAKAYSARRTPWPIWAGMGLGILLIAMWTSTQWFAPSISPLQNLTRLSPLTATDASEFYSTYSPNGRYVAFSRKAKGIHGHMWLLDTDKGQEMRLTQDAGRYGKPTWSTDGKQLAFLDTGACAAPCDSGQCVVIKQLFIPLAIFEPQSTQSLTACEPIPFLGIDWVDEQQLAVIINTATGSEISLLHAQNGERQSVYKHAEDKLYSLSYSAVNDQLAVMHAHANQTPQLQILSLSTGEITKQTFVPPNRYRSTVRWAPVWDASGNYLLFSAGAFLYSLDLHGQLHSQRIPTFEDISYPMFHPTEKRIAMTLGKIDRDIAEIQLYPPDTYSETPLARSILRENDAQYQPNGDVIGFFSRRSGLRQLWLDNQGTVSQLSNFDDVFADYFVWAPSGKQLAVATERQLRLFDLSGHNELISFPFSMSRLFQWLDDDTLLMQINDDDGTHLVRYDMRQDRYTRIRSGNYLWAQAHEDGLWLVDVNRQLLTIRGNDTTSVIDNPSIRITERFFIRGRALFFLAQDDTMWRLNIDNQQLTSLFHYTDTTVKLTDVSADGQRVLISKQLSAKKEIVELTAE